MYKVSKKQWSNIVNNHPDYAGKTMRRHEHDGKVCEAGEAFCFEYLLPGAPNTGATLVFEHIHFEIV
jgi:hypothetical protein